MRVQNIHQQMEAFAGLAVEIWIVLAPRVRR